MPTKNQYESTIEKLISDAELRISKTLTDKSPYWTDFEVWRTACRDAIDLVYGQNSRNLSEFDSIKFSFPTTSNSANSIDTVNSAQKNLIFVLGLSIANQKLKGMLYTVKNFVQEDDPHSDVVHPIIFLSRSTKSKKIADKLKCFLKNLGASVVDVIDEPNKFLSPDQKVEGYMTMCNLGLVLLTADDEMKNGEKRERPNIDHEIGMMTASPNIGKRIILLKEDKVTKLPSNCNKCYLSFNKGSFCEIYSDLVKEIRVFGFY